MDFNIWLREKSHLKRKDGFYTNPFSDGTYIVTLRELEILFSRFYKK